MGLLEKTQLKKQESEAKEITPLVEKSISSGLLQKTKQRQSQILEKSEGKKEEITPVKKPSYLSVNKAKHGSVKEVVDEKTGFGWKGLGTRQIVFDHSINEYVYEVHEPILEDYEKDLKNELARMFKMLADKNVTNMEKEEKRKYLEDTLEQIIIDNDIKFKPKPKKEEKTKEKGLKGLTSKFSRNKSEKEEKTKGEGLKGLTSKFSKNKSGKQKLSFKEKRRRLSEKEKISKDKIFYHIFCEFLGYGKIDIVMEDTGIEDISCDGHHVPIFIYHKKYEAISSNIKFDGEDDLDSFVVRLAQICSKQISIYSPIVDGKLPDGSRLQTTLSKTVTEESTFTIRKFKENPLTPIDLINFKSLSIDMAAYFWMAIENGASILFCGGTASGKTTALNALSLFIPASHKIVSIEDTREINLPHKNWIAGTTRQGFSSSEENKTGKDIDMFDLIRAGLRQRPRVVMVGEVRGKEAYSLFQAMSTGHTAYSTVHASTIHTLIQRLENPPIALPRALLTSLDIIVFQNAINIGGKSARRVISITEIIKLDPDTNQLIFMEPFRWVSKTDDRFESSGTSKILNNIRLENDWSEEKLAQEIKNRKIILNWMVAKNIRDYHDVGRIVNDYSKYPQDLVKKAKEALHS